MVRLFGRGVDAGSCSWLIASLIATGVSVPAQAGRGVVIDTNYTQIVGDAENGQTINLPFAVNYGAGAQSAVIVNLFPNLTSVTSAATDSVGLTFAGSPSNSLFAQLAGDPFGRNLPEVALSNETQTSRPSNVVTQASIFNFGTVPVPIAPPAPGAPQCDVVGISTLCYGPATSAAVFHFTDLSTSGTAGDFGLSLLCTSSCLNIGFSLNGLNFSSNSYNPLAPPAQLLSTDIVRNGNFVTSSTFNFVFRNAAPVPEPGSWAMMLLGFGMIGFAVRRQQRDIASLAT